MSDVPTWKLSWREILARWPDDAKERHRAMADSIERGHDGWHWQRASAEYIAFERIRDEGILDV